MQTTRKDSTVTRKAFYGRARRRAATRSDAWFWPLVALVVAAGLTTVTLLNRLETAPAVPHLHHQPTIQ